MQVTPGFEGGFKRTTDFLTADVFNLYHTETEMMRYMFHLQVSSLRPPSPFPALCLFHTLWVSSPLSLPLFCRDCSFPAVHASPALRSAVHLTPCRRPNLSSNV